MMVALQFVEPQLAKLVKQVPAGDGWLHEIKYDGYRILAALDRGEVTLWSRNGNDWTGNLPTVRAAVAALPATSALLDGEAAVVLPDGKTSFQSLQGGAAVTYFAFDLLSLDGEDLRPLPLEARKRRLAALVRGSDIRYSEHFADGDALFAKACAARLEGIVCKRRDAPYTAGRSSDWVKVKCTMRQELVIGGFTDPEGARVGIGALLCGVYSGDRLIYSGKVGTGFTNQLATELRAELAPLEEPRSPFTTTPAKKAHWVRPVLVAEVEFTEWTADGKIRHPSFKGLRRDKPARDVVRE
jgi:bifunctional non-homologous end joining protein LigD